MIRKLKDTDIDKVAKIWLDTNIKVHDFIPPQYWQNNYNMVKEMFLLTEVYVYENAKEIHGFIGLHNEYIEGIFVSSKAQSQGIGKLLLNIVKDKKEKLRLSVYQKNTRAIHFYQREGFKIQCESLDKSTGEKEYVMIWE